MCCDLQKSEFPFRHAFLCRRFSLANAVSCTHLFTLSTNETDESSKQAFIFRNSMWIRTSLKCQNYLESLSKFSRYLLNSVQRWCLFRTVSRNIPYFLHSLYKLLSKKSDFFLKKNSFNTRSEMLHRKRE